MISPQKFLVEGVGKGSIPGCLDTDIIDDVIQVSDPEAFQTCHELAKKEGLLVGGSAGLNTFAALKIANETEVKRFFFKNLQFEISNLQTFQVPAVIVTVLCDLGVKYLTKVYNDSWLKQNNVTMVENGD